MLAPRRHGSKAQPSLRAAAAAAAATVAARPAAAVKPAAQQQTLPVLPKKVTAPSSSSISTSSRGSGAVPMDTSSDDDYLPPLPGASLLGASSQGHRVPSLPLAVPFTKTTPPWSSVGPPWSAVAGHKPSPGPMTLNKDSNQSHDDAKPRECKHPQHSATITTATKPLVAMALARPSWPWSDVLQIGWNLAKEQRAEDIPGNNVTETERQAAWSKGIALTFGEIWAEGVDWMLSPQCLDAKNASVLFDLGHGLGKCAVQAFLQWPNLMYVLGVEACPSRYAVSTEALGKLVARSDGAWRIMPDEKVGTEALPRLVVEEVVAGQPRRTLELRQGNALETDIGPADIVICDIDFRRVRFPPCLARSLCCWSQLCHLWWSCVSLLCSSWLAAVFVASWCVRGCFVINQSINAAV